MYHFAISLPRCLFRGVLACALALACVGAYAAQDQVQFTEEGFVYIDGQPRLILGSYELPDDDTVLQELADNGYNLVRAKADKAVLDRIHAHGMYAWIPLGGKLALKEGDTAARAGLAATIEGFKGHPALLSWEGPDEALWLEWFRAYDWITSQQPAQLMELLGKAAADQPAEKVAELGVMLDKAIKLSYRGLWKESEALYDTLWKELAGANPHPERHVSVCIARAHELGDELTRGWECVWELDKRHVFWQNHAPGNSIADMQHHNRAVHAAGCDIYPMPFNTGVRHGQLADKNVTEVGGYTDIMDASAPGKACWMVLQGFGWCDLGDRFNPTDPVNGRRPTYDETRFMAYNALLHGADAILYWGTHAIEKDSKLWRDLMKVGRELRALEPALVAPKPATEPVAVAEGTFASANGDQVKLVLRQAGDDWVLFAHNESPIGAAFQVSGLPDALNGKTLYRLDSDEEHLVEAGGFRDGVRGHDVQVYATSRRFEAE
ncbi:MAG: hypothetical protein JXR94_00245 [Candidatus Hydrogenedentes bacterium]|nr:hypothetical protein [Candidatus Hydrogenedentota bacterium]